VVKASEVCWGASEACVGAVVGISSAFINLLTSKIIKNIINILKLFIV
jgi:hypothetical protein